MSHLSEDYLDYIWGPMRSSNKENKDMKNKFAVWGTDSFKYATYEEAEKAAKQKTGNDRCGSEYVIAQAIASTKAPVPEIEVVKF